MVSIQMYHIFLTKFSEIWQKKIPSTAVMRLLVHQDKQEVEPILKLGATAEEDSATRRSNKKRQSVVLR